MTFATRLIHAGMEPDPSTGAIIPPIYQTSSFVQAAPGDHKGYEYARSQNPTRTALEKALASGADAEALLTRIVSFLGSSREEAQAVLTKLGWKQADVKDAAPVWRKAPQKRGPPKPRETPVDPNSPFARLAALKQR